MKDFFTILKQNKLYRPANHHQTNNTYELNNNHFEFFPADDASRIHGARRNILFLNEIQNIKFDVADQLKIRTDETTIWDYNPTHLFWVDEKIIPYKDIFDYAFIQSSFMDNPYLPDESWNDILRRKKLAATGDTYWINWWNVYGEGLPGQLEGAIFNNWVMVDEVPEDCKWFTWGLDFGYTNDPSTLIKVGLKGDELYCKEIFYQTGLTNQDIANRMHQLQGEIIADSAEPKSIEEIHRMGFNIKGATKGADSIKNGIDIMKRYNIKITKGSINLIKEFRNYQWQTDKNGKALNEPIDEYNHGIDAVRYVCLNKIGTPKRKFIYA